MQIQVRDPDGNPIPGINYRISLGSQPQELAIYDNYTDKAGNSGWPIPYWPDIKYTLYFNVANVNPSYSVATHQVDNPQNDIIVVLEKLFPEVPTREQVCGVKLTFQGLTIHTNQYGTLPWFEPAYQTLTDVDDRISVCQQKKDAGDTHLILEFFTHQQSIYDEAGQPYQNAITKSGEDNPDWFLSLVEEVIINGLIPIVVFDGDDGIPGAVNALRQLPILVSLLKSSQYGDLTKYVLFGRLWDGVFYGATPQQIYDFGTAFRQLVPEGYLAIEHQPGRIPCGEGDADYVTGGGMTTYDVLMSEFDYPPSNDTIWQIAARLLGPSYVRPSDQPANDDPGSPFGPNAGEYYLRMGNPRGQFFACAFEWWDEYNWVRIGNPLSPQALQFQRDCQQRRQYLKNCGYIYLG